MNLVLVDIDGTLTDTNDIDTSCFIQALNNVFGISDVNSDWTTYPSVTDSALTDYIVRARLTRASTAEEFSRMQREFHSPLTAQFAASPETCTAIMGGREFLKSLTSRPKFAVAFATGGWAQTARLKLRAAGYAVSHLPLSSSDGA